MADIEVDKKWIDEIKKITDPNDLMNELAILHLEVHGVGDPYYRDLYEAICERAIELRETYNRNKRP
jgi:hypothetical protein